VSCYVRHIKEQLAEAGLADDRAGRREADRRVRASLDMADDDCPDVWRRVKSLDREAVLELLRRTG
jgi:hypothetical protein